jgi:hypothetical protein
VQQYFFRREGMKAALALLLLSVPAFGQNSTVSTTESACGPGDVQFRVKTQTLQSMPAPEPGQALVFVVEDQKFKAVRDVTARVGLDGSWVGANRGNTFLYFAVQPGEHRLCTDWISDFLPNGRAVSLAHFVAESGKIYYFQARTVGFYGSLSDGHGLQLPNGAGIDLDLVDSDEGKLLVETSELSVSHPRK